MTPASRVLHRWLRRAKGGVSLLPEYHAALEKLRAGDRDPAKAFCSKVLEIILPDGNRPDWLAALSVQKANAINSLYRETSSLKDSLGATKVHDEQKWNEYCAFNMEKLAKALRTLELASEIGDTEREVQHGPFIVIPIPGITKAELTGALAALDEAAKSVRPKFPEVLYGKVYLARHLSKKAAAWYDQGSDTLSLNVKARKRFNDVFTLIHEFGHRHERKFCSNAGKNRYWELSTRKVYETIHFDAKLREQVADEAVSMAKLRAMDKPIPAMSSQLETWLKSSYPTGDIPKAVTKFLNYVITEEELHALVKGKKDGDVMTSNVISGPLHVTPYGATNPRENYADGFAHFVLGMDMPAPLAEILGAERK